MGKGRAAGRVRLFVGNRGSDRVNVSPGRVGSKKSDPWTTLQHTPFCTIASLPILFPISFDSCSSHCMLYRMTRSVEHRAIEVYFYYYYFRRKIRKGRSQMVLLHLALALLAVDIIILADIRPIKERCLDQISNYVGCRAVAALLHYFLLVSFLWMLVEAVIQYLKFVKVFDTYTPRFMLKAALPAWRMWFQLSYFVIIVVTT